MEKLVCSSYNFEMVYFIHSISLRKEVADGLRIYFDFILRDYLLYKQEREQALQLLSPENLHNFSYIGSEKPYVKLKRTKRNI